MILRSLEVKHFGRFAEHFVEFRRGMNLVVGPNEAGKSTLMEAVPAVLFGLRNKERYRPWGRQGSSEAALTLEARDRTVCVAREVHSDRVTLVERDDLYHTLYSFEGKAAPQGRSSERSEYLQQLQRLFGLAEDDLFRASLFFGQGSLEIPVQGGLAAKIKTLLSGFAEVDYDRVLESLQEDYFAVTRESPWGKDKTRNRELDETRRRMGELEERWFAAREAAKRLAELRRQLAKLSDSIAADRSDYAKGEKYLAWVRRQWELEVREESLQKDFARVSRETEKIAGLEKEREHLHAELARTGLPTPIPDELPQLLAEAEEGRRELVSLQGEANALRQELLRHSSTPWRLYAGLTALFFLLGGAAAWWRPAWTGAALLAAALASVSGWAVYLWQAGRNRAERSRIKGQAQVLERQRADAQERLVALDDRFQGLGMSPSAVEIARMQKNLARARELDGRLREVESALQVLEKAETLSSEKAQLTRKLAVLDERLEKERPLAREGVLRPEELPAAEEKLAALGESLQQREEQLLELTRQEAALQGELVDLQAIEEEGERLKERESQLVRRKQALATGFDLLTAAVDEFRRTYLERFAAETSQYLALATHGRYDAVRVDEHFALALKSRGQWQPVEHFSRGTVDAVYFAVRLALTRHLSRGHNLPLLLDDPLVNFDGGRLGEALKTLEQLAREHQVIYFTHDETLLRRAAQKRWHVVSLDEMKPVPPSQPQERSEDAGQLCLL